jgi:hypothetical protein
MQVTVVADQVSYDTHLEEEIHPRWLQQRNRYLLMPTGGVQAEAIYSAVLCDGFWLWKGEKGREGFIRTHIDCIVIAVGYRVPFRQKKRLRFPVFRAAGVIAAVL